MKHVFPIFCSILVGGVPAWQDARGELPLQSPDQLKNGASLIAVGTVEEQEVGVEGKGGNSDWVVRFGVAVEKVEKGDFGRDETLRVRSWRMKKRPAGWVGPSGHGPIPAKGARVRLFLREGGGEWEPLLPNGIELLDGSASIDLQAIAEERFSVSAWRAAGTWIGIAILVIAGWLVARRRQREPVSG